MTFKTFLTVSPIGHFIFVDRETGIVIHNSYPASIADLLSSLVYAGKIGAMVPN